MKDYFGNELHINDTVAYVPPYGGVSYFKTGVIIGFTAKMVRIIDENHLEHVGDKNYAIMKAPTGLIMKK